MVHIEPSEFETRFLQKLNPQQREAVQTINGNILLLATPGSGKTTVLVTRLGYMICCKGIDPANILTMTYTRAATKDMKERFASFFGEEAAEKLQFRTINGVSAKIIQAASSLRGEKSFTLQADESALTLLIRQIYQTLNEEYAEDSVVKEIKTEISYIKNMMLTEEEIDAFQSDIKHLPDIYRQYRAVLRRQCLMDYDDQMVYALSILRKMPSILNQFQNQFQYVCVDEAQDTSKIQHEIIKILAEKCGNLFMVGDEDQSIYGFRAAYPEALLNFGSDHPGARVLLMEENYRSTPEIIDLANRFISRNESRHEKTIHPTRDNGNPIHVIHCKDREAQFMLLLEMGKNCEKETAILFRNNDSALPLIDLFEKNGICYNCRNIDEVFFTHRVVTDILDIIQLAYDPNDSERFMRLYYKFGVPISKKSATEAVRRSTGSGKPILEELLHIPDIKGFVQDAVRDLIEYLPEIRKDSAETAIHRIWEALHYGRYVESNGLDGGKYFILRLLAKDIPTASAFKEKLDELRRTISSHVNSNENKLILSTIHSSKGLEYERVFLLDMIDGVIPSKVESAIQTTDEWKIYEEERRLYYVAMTRAKNDLYLFRFPAASSFIEESCDDLPVPVCEEDDIFASLQTPQIGKSYTDKEWGKGEIEAQFDDLFHIRFRNGTLRRMRLDEMILRRDKSATDQQRPAKKKKQPTMLRSGISSSYAMKRITVGSTVRHKAFGLGTVQKIDGGIAAIRFRNGDTKKLLLQACISKGLLEIPKQT